MKLEKRLIFVKGLRLDAAIGVHAHEQGRTQPLMIDAEIELERHPITDLTHTLNYELVGRLAHKLIGEGHIELVESFAEALACGLLALPYVLGVTLSVSKPQALDNAHNAGCQVIVSHG
jgi:7,8-dihydroneopterin aldolase/epimerase/oxygenase